MTSWATEQPYSEHKSGGHITYRLTGEPSEYSGVILWVCEKTEQVGMCYVVAGDRAGDSFPDIVFPTFIGAAS